jgi:N-acetylglucosamine repressor
MSVHPLRGQNRSRLLAALSGHQVRSRPDLAQQLGLSLMAVTRITRELIEVGLIEEGEQTIRPDLSGRRPTELKINPAGAFVIGLGVYAYEQSAVLMDLAGRIVRRCALEPRPSRQNSECLADWAQIIKTKLLRKDIDRQRVLGAGLAITGNVDTERGILLDAPYIGWAKMNIARELKDELGLPVTASGAARALLSASRRGAGDQLDNALLFNVGFAIGGSILIDGRVASGAQLQAGQVGHMPTDRIDRSCSCGRKGCLNAVASGWTAMAELGEVDGQSNSAEEFRASRTKLARLLRDEREGDDAACKALRRAGRELGRAAAKLFVALDPARIYLSGPVGLTQSYLDGAREGFAPFDASLVERCESKLDAAAASLALEKFVFSPELDFDQLRKAATGEIAA